MKKIKKRTLPNMEIKKKSGGDGGEMGRDGKRWGEILGEK